MRINLQFRVSALLAAMCVAGSIMGLLIVSCNDGNVETGLDKYIYRDDDGVIHVSADCEKLKDYDIKDSRNHHGYAMQPTDTADFHFQYTPRFCAVCVSSSDVEHLYAISERYHDNEKRKEAEWCFYRALTRYGYDMEPFEEFTERLKIASKRRAVYDALRAEGFDAGTYESFSKELGY